jgi:hypothetical protein
MKPGFLMIGSAVLLGTAALVIGQMPVTDEDGPSVPLPPPKVGTDTVRFASKVGSFKLLGSDQVVPTGKLSFSFNGSVLITGLDGKMTIEGKVIKEYDSKEFSKATYSGKGKITIDGKVRSVQFFGRDIDASFKGIGIIRLYGEFDRNLETGWYEYAGGERRDWGTGGTPVTVPQMVYGPSSGSVKVKEAG